MSNNYHHKCMRYVFMISWLAFLEDPRPYPFFCPLDVYVLRVLKAAYLDGIQLHGYIVHTIEHTQWISWVITNRFSTVSSFLSDISVSALWLTKSDTFDSDICCSPSLVPAAVMLFITSSRLDHLEQAHGEAYAQTEVQTSKVSTVHCNTNKEQDYNNCPWWHQSALFFWNG